MHPSHSRLGILLYPVRVRGDGARPQVYGVKTLLNPTRQTYQWTISAKPERLWLALNSAERLAETIGLPPGKYTSRTAGKLDVDATAAGGLLARLLMPQWREPPTQWIEGRWLKISRGRSQGLIANISWTIALEPQGPGCLVRHEIVIVPRSMWAGIILTLFRRHLDRTMNEIGRTVALWAKGDIDHPMPRPKALPRQTRATLSDRAMLADGSQYGNGQVSRLVRWMSQAQHQDTVRIRPTAIANHWGNSQDEMAEILLAAAAAGILIKHWSMTCTNCGLATSDSKTLKDLPEGARCPACSSKVEIDLAHNVEMVFTPADDLRGFQNRRYAFESPSDHPTVGVRIKVEAKGRLTTKWKASRSGFLARDISTGSSTTFTADNGSPRLLLNDGVISAMTGDQAPGTVDLVNNDGVERHVALGPIESVARGSTARQILLLQAHRDLGGKELPREGAAFVLRDVAILATDLSGLATRYQKSGDAGTFKAVSDLLREVTDIVRECGGSISSRLGEIVVAAFPEPRQAVAAAFRLSSHNENVGLQAFRGSIDAGELSATAHKGRLILQGASIKSATKALGILSAGELALGSKLLGAPSVIKLIQGYPLAPIGNGDVDGGKIQIGGQPKRSDDSSDQSASAA